MSHKINGLTNKLDSVCLAPSLWPRMICSLQVLIFHPAGSEKQCEWIFEADFSFAWTGFLSRRNLFTLAVFRWTIKHLYPVWVRVQICQTLFIHLRHRFSYKEECLCWKVLLDTLALHTRSVFRFPHVYHLPPGPLWSSLKLNKQYLLTEMQKIYSLNCQIEQFYTFCWTESHIFRFLQTLLSVSFSNVVWRLSVLYGLQPVKTIIKKIKRRHTVKYSWSRVSWGQITGNIFPTVLINTVGPDILHYNHIIIKTDWSMKTPGFWAGLLC